MHISELQEALKNKTHDIHKKAENHPLMQEFIKGDYKKEHYLQYLINILPIYTVVESRILRIPIQNNSDLKRTNLIEEDIQILNTEIKDKFLNTPLKITCTWVGKAWHKPTDLLKAELYCRWLADLYGGQILRKSLTPNQTYTCQNTQRAIIEVRNILDTPSTVSVDKIVQEVEDFFKFHIDLFDQIYNGNT